MPLITVEAPRLYTVEGRHFIHAPAGTGAALQDQLATYGIHAEVSRLAAAPFDRLELQPGVDPPRVQEILDHWGR